MLPMGYKQAIIEYVEENPNATGSDVSEAIGCSTDTVYRHWDAADTSTDTQTDTQATDSEVAEAADTQPEPEPEDTPEPEPEDEQDAKEAEFEDTQAKTYECAECGGDLEYLEKQCDCGAQPLWSAIEEAEQ